MISERSFSPVDDGGAEGSRTPTGWNLNPVPLPVGLRPRWWMVWWMERCWERVAGGGVSLSWRVEGW